MTELLIERLLFGAALQYSMFRLKRFAIGEIRGLLDRNHRHTGLPRQLHHPANMEFVMLNDSGVPIVVVMIGGNSAIGIEHRVRLGGQNWPLTEWRCCPAAH